MQEEKYEAKMEKGEMKIVNTKKIKQEERRRVLKEIRQQVRTPLLE